MILISVVISTYNPHLSRLKLTLDGLRNQTLAYFNWELIIIDNNSDNNFHEHLDLTWQPNFRLLTEEEQGLTYARIRGFKTAEAEIIVMVDDDNILDENYLSNVASIFNANPYLGAIGGISTPLFETTPAKWVESFYPNLALRDLGRKNIINRWENNYPEASPIGAGMGLRKTALKNYLHKICSGNNIVKDRTKLSLSSGGDNDIVLEVLKAGWEIGYFPDLSLTHIIPDARTGVRYLAKLIYDSNVSWVSLLASHQIYPWRNIPPYTYVPRCIKAWFMHKAWMGNKNYIQWRGACGLFKGLSIDGKK
ncbi:glycosyltransferase family 2 protein [Pedobacter sp. G11]|uniref:glycosyltransferase n=1 Tax=Pedobacter sp. G11 TaxID=2482728 RepID=UPI000F5D7F34|nr:glycosyltransferase [Pedobacter sp. G11]AZI25844.1 glycosyltransferase family 2 protein [Pedobacter sp. G11]